MAVGTALAIPKPLESLLSRRKICPNNISCFLGSASLSCARAQFSAFQARSYTTAGQQAHKNGSSLYAVMRSLGLWATNYDLNQDSWEQS